MKAKANESALYRVGCDAKMYHMKKASVRDLRYRFSVVEDLLRNGHEIQITKRERVIARLLPPEPTVPVEMPDFLGRMKKIFGKKRIKVSGAQQLAAERERF
jgi:antitoxin (DNA-binding transcriptional repressor) of toxin-antitoxin stability system